MSIKGSQSSQLSSSSNHTIEDIGKIIDGLPQELLNAMKEQNIVLLGGVENVKKPLSKAIYHAKQKELIKPLRTQLNFRMPQTIKISKDDTIKKDLLFYKKAYEEEAANINKIVNATNVLNNQLLDPLKTIKETLKNYIEDFKNNLKNVGNPYHHKKEGIDNININNNEEDKNNFEEKIKEVNKEMDLYQQQSIKFLQDYQSMNEELSNDIKIFIDSFQNLIDSVNNLKKEITVGFTAFENSSPEFEDLEVKEKIKNAMSQIMKPLTKITELISESETRLSEAQKNEIDNKQNSGLANKMIIICDELKEKAKLISEKINAARVKVNLNPIKVKEFEIKAPDMKNIEENISQIKEKIEETNKKNSVIKEQVYKKTEDFINQSRLDILFIIDSTNSINTYLEEIKKNFNDMINKIYNNCPTSTIYIGFIGYTDFSELDFGEEYIDIDFTKNKEEINEKIKELTSHGGGDEPEDLCGAFDLALKKNWKGCSRFAILATDAPCHGIEYHSPDIEDNYPNGDPLNRDIKIFVKEFAEKKISLFCAGFNESTDNMYEIFDKKYKEGKTKDSDCEFTVQNCTDLCETIIQKATNIYKNKKIEEVK